MSKREPFPSVKAKRDLIVDATFLGALDLLLGSCAVSRTKARCDAARALPSPAARLAAAPPAGELASAFLAALAPHPGVLLPCLRWFGEVGEALDRLSALPSLDDAREVEELEAALAMARLDQERSLAEIVRFMEETPAEDAAAGSLRLMVRQDPEKGREAARGFGRYLIDVCAAARGRFGYLVTSSDPAPEAPR